MLDTVSIGSGAWLMPFFASVEYADVIHSGDTGFTPRVTAGPVLRLIHRGIPSLCAISATLFGPTSIDSRANTVLSDSIVPSVIVRGQLHSLPSAVSTSHGSSVPGTVYERCAESSDVVFGLIPCEIAAASVNALNV